MSRRETILPLVALGVVVANHVAAWATRDALFLSSFDFTRLPYLLVASMLTSIVIALPLIGRLRGAAWCRSCLGSRREHAVVPGRMGARRSIPARRGGRGVRSSRCRGALVYSTFVELMAESRRTSRLRPRYDRIVVSLLLGCWSEVSRHSWWDARCSRADAVGSRGAERRRGSGGARLVRSHAAPSGPRNPIRCHSRVPAGGLPVLDADTEHPAAYVHFRRRCGWRCTRRTRRDLRRLLLGRCARCDRIRVESRRGSPFLRGDDLLRFFAIFYTVTSLFAYALVPLVSRRSLDRNGLATTVAAQPWTVLAGVVAILAAPGSPASPWLVGPNWSRDGRSPAGVRAAVQPAAGFGSARRQTVRGSVGRADRRSAGRGGDRRDSRARSGVGNARLGCGRGRARSPHSARDAALACGLRAGARSCAGAANRPARSRKGGRLGCRPHSPRLAAGLAGQLGCDPGRGVAAAPRRRVGESRRSRPRRRSQSHAGVRCGEHDPHGHEPTPAHAPRPALLPPRVRSRPTWLLGPAKPRVLFQCLPNRRMLRSPPLDLHRPRWQIGARWRARTPACRLARSAARANDVETIRTCSGRGRSIAPRSHMSCHSSPGMKWRARRSPLCARWCRR